MALLDRDDKPTVHERVGRALSTGNLRQSENPCDLDKVAALGAVGIEERLADAVFRLKYANDPYAYEDAVDGVRSLARRLNEKERWRLRDGRLRRMSKRVLNYWLADVCRLCSGVGYEVVPNSPHLSDRACPACNGERKRPMPWVRKLPKEPEGRMTLALRQRIEGWGKWCKVLERFAYRHRLLLVTLEEVERRIGAKMIAKLAQNVRAL